MTKKTTKALALAAVLTIGAGMMTTFAGCGDSTTTPTESSGTGTTATDASSKKLTIGSAAYIGAIFDGGIDPAMSYASWSTFRYGIGECLVTFDENMQVQPWLAKSFEQKDAKTWVFELNDGVKFHNGNACDAAAVKASLERVMKLNSEKNNKGGRVGDVNNMLIDSITAEGNTLTIKTTEENSILANLLCDPLWVIIDASVETDGRNNVVGTGPYKLVKASDEGCTVVANNDYWNGTPKIGTIEVKTINDGDTLTMALQSGEIDAAQELPVDSLALFSDTGKYTISTAATSRSSNMVFNTKSKYMSDLKVRQACALALNKQDFIDGLMSGYGELAIGFFPQSFSTFGDSKLTDTYSYNVEKAKELLKEAGWEDTNGDGYVDKDGENMVLTYKTYTSRQDLPRLAEAYQDDLKDIGIKMEIDYNENSWNTDDMDKKGADSWDINCWQMVTAPNGDPMYMIDSTLGKDGYYRYGGAGEDKELQGMIDELRNETDSQKRADLAVKIQQYAVDNCYMQIAFHKEQSWAMSNTVTGLTEHPTDQHEITVDTDINK